MVAKTYQNGWTIISQPYEENKKLYIDIQKNTTNIIPIVKKARWYSEKEYAKLYPEDKININSKYIGVDGCDHSKDPYFKTQKELLGFKNGFIYIFKGALDKEYLKSIGAVQRSFGWTLSSELELPELPAGIIAEKILWSAVGDDTTERLKNLDDVFLINNIAAPTIDGSIGDRLTLNLEVIDSKEKKNNFGAYCEMTFKNEKNQLFFWKTGAKFWSIGEQHKIKGTIKEFNNNITVLTRCNEVK